jgi:hypothetical protein
MLRDLARRLGGLGRLERLVLVAWLVAMLVVSIRAARFPHRTVYPIFTGAARNWVAGEDLYRPVGEPYRYSPLVTTLFIPFSVFPDPLGGVIWRWLSVGVYVGALAWWATAVLPQPLTRAQWTWFFLLVLPLSVGNFNNGQSNTLLIAMLLLAVAALASGQAGRTSGWRETFAAGCVTLACLFKVYPIALGLLVGLVWPRRFTGRLLLLLAVGLLLPFLLQRPGYVAEQYLGWLHHLETSDRHNLPPELWYRDFQLLCWAWHLPLSTAAYRVVQLLTAAGCAAGCLAARRAGWPERRLLALVTVLGCVWMTAFGSATESSTYILMAPVAGWSCLLAWQGRCAALVRGVLAGGYGLLAVAQLANMFPWGQRVHMAGVQPLGTLLLLAGLLAVLVERHGSIVLPRITPSWTGHPRPSV